MNIRRIQVFLITICITTCIFSLPGVASAQTGEEELLTLSTTAPDALIILDLSLSMGLNPVGELNRQWGASTSCAPDAACSGAGCSGGFCAASKSGCAVDCSRVGIAKRAIFGILDDTQDGQIYSGTHGSTDDASLGIRIGLMSFQNCSAGSSEASGIYNTYDSHNYTSTGCSQLRQPISTTSTSATKYSVIYCGNSTSCNIDTSCGSLNCVNGSTAAGSTPLGAALFEGKQYLDWHKSQDTYQDCRKKFAILFTDGEDTLACGADGTECAANRYKNRREAVARAKELGDAGYQLFVIGYGSNMPPYLQNTLNWMAYYGGTDNPDISNTGNVTAYNIPSGCDSVTNPTACCVLNTTALATSTNPSACYPSGVTQCGVDSAPATATCWDASNPYPGAGVSTNNFRAGSNDPGYSDLSGYAFLATDANTLTTALKSVFSAIRWATYSFTQASVQSSRTADENFLYEASFDYIATIKGGAEPFWHGHLKKYQINADGTVGNMLLDGADVLQSTNADTRTMKTLISGALTPFTKSINPSYFGYASTNTAARDAVVGYIRGEVSANPDVLSGDVYKLGDIFRSSPITVGTPSFYYDDNRDTNYAYTCSGPSLINAFSKFRCDHPRTSANGYRIIVAGANDGQLHAFKTSDMSEVWSFIPPNLLSKLNKLSHGTHPANLNHTYFVDGPVTVADVWWSNYGTNLDGTIKDYRDWNTLLFLAEGRGSNPTLWSSSSTCDSGFSAVYVSPYSYYCGYYTLNVTGTLSPAFLWHLGGTSTLLDPANQAPYLGDPWSKMMPGKVLINGRERWVAFVGAGYNASDCSGGGACDKRGKGFFIVDVKDGKVLRSFTLFNDTRMKYSLPGTAAIVDVDNDGFIDTAYIGDLGGNVWRFKLCTRADGATCNESSWQQTLLYDSSTGTIRPIYTMPAAAIDGAGNLWIYWGTGDKSDPTASNAQEKIYGLKDNNRTTTYRISDLDNITSSGATYDNTSSPKAGYYINISGSGEKILADPIVFGGVLYFTTYTPPQNKPCEQTGEASLYGINYTSGAGALPGGNRGMSIGQGIPSSAVVSTAQGASKSDIYVTTSSGGGVQRVPIDPPGGGMRSNIRFWRDQRLQ